MFPHPFIFEGFSTYPCPLYAANLPAVKKGKGQRKASEKLIAKEKKKGRRMKIKKLTPEKTGIRTNNWMSNRSIT